MKTKKPSIKKNYIYNLLFQVFALITPLITTPYVARVLSAEGTGQYSFATSINSYFCMFAALGFGIYAQREITKNQGNVKQQSFVFWEIVICKALVGIAVFGVCWILILFGVFGQHTLLMQLLSIEIMGNVLNIAFLFQGNEKFRLIAVRDFVIRLISVTLIFCFVKSQSDLWIYALCNAGSFFASSISLWFCTKGSINRVNLKDIKPFKHFLPSLKMFIPTIAISIFTILDKTLIGVLIPGTIEVQMSDGSISIAKLADIENGYYAQSEKIIKIVMMIIASLGSVMMPRNSKELADGNEEQFAKNIKKALVFSFFIGTPMWAGLSAVAYNFSPWFFGNGYEKVPSLIIIFSFMILPSGIGNVLGQQYLISKGEDNKYILVYVLSALLNLILNLILIPIFYSIGATIASVIAEVFAPIIMLFFLRKKISFVGLIKENWKALFSSLVMFSIVFITSLFLKSSILNTAILIVEGIVVYFALLLILKYRMMLECLTIVKNIFKKKEKSQ